jgi:hypothetical protein
VVLAGVDVVSSSLDGFVSVQPDWIAPAPITGREYYWFWSPDEASPGSMFLYTETQSTEIIYNSLSDGWIWSELRATNFFGVSSLYETEREQWFAIP